jgi:hypothetical protein
LLQKKRQKKGFESMGVGGGRGKHAFFQAFYFLNMLIFFLFFLCCLVVSVVQKQIVDFHFMHPLP